MKQLILFFLLSLVNSKMIAQVPYNYQTGNLTINTITYNVSVSGNMGFDDILVLNSTNILNNTPNIHPEIECGEVHLSKAEWTRVENVFRQVFPVARRKAFRASKSQLSYSIYASEAGQIQEVAFSFLRGNLITPQEMYQLEVGLKALIVQYNFPPVSCAGVRYRNISTSVNISEL